MTNNELRIRVAELSGRSGCGYRHQNGSINNDGCFVPVGETEFSREGHGYMTDDTGALVPDYPNDLNAMHEAEKTLTGNLDADDGTWKVYLSKLADVLTRDDQVRSLRRGFVQATARQRAEAFVLTMGGHTE